jgi:two-component SAPR family response regulator
MSVHKMSSICMDIKSSSRIITLKYPNGFELFQKIRDKDKRVKVCFITAFEDYHNQFQELFPNLEVDCFIKKPIPSNELVKIVKAKLNC